MNPSAVLLLLFATYLAGCAGPSDELVEQDSRSASHVLYETDLVGDLVILYEKVRPSACTLSVNMTQFLVAPALVFATYKVPRPEDVLLESIGLKRLGESMQVFGEQYLNSASYVDGRTSAAWDDNSIVASKHVLIAPGIVDDGARPNFEFHAHCEVPGAIEISSTGGEYVAVFPSSQTDGVSYWGTTPVTGVTEARFDLEASRTFTSPHVQAVYFGGGNRAGVLRVTAAGMEEILPMTTLQLLSYEGGPGEWGFAEDGVQYLAPRVAYIVGTE